MLGAKANSDDHIDVAVDVENLASTFKNVLNIFAPQAEQKPEEPKQENLKMPEVPIMQPPVPEVPVVVKPDVVEKKPEVKPVVGHVDEEYVIEDVSIVEEMSMSQLKNPLEDKHQPKVEQLNNWTPKPVVEQELSKEEIYKIEAAAEAAPLRDALMQLFEFGFTNFQQNKELLQKFCCSVEQTVQALLEDAELYD